MARVTEMVAVTRNVGRGTFPMVSPREMPQTCTVEELLRRIAEVSVLDVSFELWVAHYLTWGGQLIAPRAAFKIVLDAIRDISEDFVPVGFIESPGGRLHQFERWPDSEPVR